MSDDIHTLQNEVVRLKEEVERLTADRNFFKFHSEDLQKQFEGVRAIATESLDDGKTLLSLNATLREQNRELYELIQELFALLNEHEPNWYKQGHFRRISAVLAKVEGSAALSKTENPHNPPIN